MTDVHFLISGRVQGVGFRRFVARIAQEHRISGWVTNTDDGNVEVCASGDTSDLAQFVQLCRQGPIFAKVIDLTFFDQKNPPISTDQGINGFYITR